MKNNILLKKNYMNFATDIQMLMNRLSRESEKWLEFKLAETYESFFQIFVAHVEKYVPECKEYPKSADALCETIFDLEPLIYSVGVKAERIGSDENAEQKKIELSYTEERKQKIKRLWLLKSEQRKAAHQNAQELPNQDGVKDFKDENCSD